MSIQAPQDVSCDVCDEPLGGAPMGGSAHQYSNFWLCSDCQVMYDEAEWQADRAEGLPLGDYTGKRCLCCRTVALGENEG